MIVKENQTIRRFREVGAVSRESAEPLSVLELKQSRVFKILLAQGVFHETPEHSYWIDCRGAKAFAIRRRNRLVFALLIVAAGFGISYL